MHTPEARQDPQARELERLERQAGLSQTLKTARAGRALPPGVMGDHASPQAYVAHDYDQRRGATRDAYFSVDDGQLRKQLIALCRKIDSDHRHSADEQIDTAQREIAIVSARLKRLPWGKVTLLSAALVAFGYWTSQGAGAIAGAVAAVFLGLGVIINARNNAKLGLVQATRKLDQAKMAQADYALFPEVFSSSEEQSGQRDSDFDAASAYRNIAHKQNNQP